MIIWAGISNKDVGMVIEHYPHIILPKRKLEVQKVPGRNGDIVLDQGAFENYEQKYNVFLDSKYLGGLEQAMPKVVDWLLGHPGYQRLEDSYFPDVYRMAYFSGGTDFVSVFNEYGEGELTFTCAPEKYLKSGDITLNLENGQTVLNPTNFPAKPLLTITGSGVGSIFFASDSGNHAMSIANIGGSIVLDIREHSAFSGITNKNGLIEGRYEDMELGNKTTISWTGGISKVEMNPRWWTI